MKGKANRKEKVYAQKRTEDIDWGCMDEPDDPISGKQQRLMMRTEISHKVQTVDQYGNETGSIRRIHPAKGMKPKSIMKNKGTRHPMKWQKKEKKAEKQMVRTSLERYNVKYYTLRGDQLPEDSMCFISIGQRKVSKLTGYKVLLDTGSTISTVTPVQAKRLVEELGWEIKKGQKFTVENGGEVDEIFDGSYIKMPVQRPNSSKFIAIRFYVSPHNDIPYPLILGIKDMRCLGYSAVAQKCPMYRAIMYLGCIWMYLQGKKISWVIFRWIFLDVSGMYRCYRYIQAKYIPDTSTFFPIHPKISSEK